MTGHRDKFKIPKLAGPMPKSSLDKSGSAGADLPQSLTDRVRARVTEAALSVDRRARATRPRARRSDEVREAQSLRRVFRDMGDTYRHYRRRTGEAVSPDVRAAAVGFKQKPTLASLVLVAAYLDGLDILTW